MKQIMLGNEAVARGAYEAGVKVVSSYPGTPSTEITETIATYDRIYCDRCFHPRSPCDDMHEACWYERCC